MFIRKIVLSLSFFCVASMVLFAETKSKSLFEESFEGSPKDLNALWKDDKGGELKVDWVKGYQGQALSISVPAGNTGNNKVYKIIDSANLLGATVNLSGMVKAVGVSEKPKSYNGIKLSLRIVSSSGKASYSQVTLNSGTYDWTRYGTLITIPKDTKSVALMVGLEAVTGTALFDEVTIEKAE